jgi:hypothetical protein
MYNCQDHLLKFKPEQYTSQSKVMPLNFQPHVTLVLYFSLVLLARETTSVCHLPTVGQYHFTESAQTSFSNALALNKHYCVSQKMAQAHNTNKILTHVQN